MRTTGAVLFVIGTGAALHCAPDAVLVEGATGSGAAAGAGGGGMDPGPCTQYSDVPIVDCDLLAQDCPPPKRCAIATQDGAWFTYCADPNGGKAAGEPCVSGECGTGLTCLAGHCSPVCCLTTDEPCGDEAFCLGHTTYGPYFTYRCLYVPSCELLTPGACDGVSPPSACHLIPFHARSACVPASPDGVVPEGALCDALNECGESQLCWPFQGPAGTFCRFNCFLDGSGSSTPGLGGCPVGQSCIDLELDQPNIGICLPP